MAFAFLLSMLATIATAAAVALGWCDRIDRRVMALVHVRQPLRADGKPRRLVTAARDLMAIGGDTVRLLFLAGCVAALLADGRAATAGRLVVIFALARGALYLMKHVVRRPRPDGGGHGVVTYTSSFPSGHTFMAVVLYLAAALLLPDGVPIAVMHVAAVFALAIALLVGAVRVSFGVHWPSDILAGWTAGIAWTTGCLWLGGVAGG